MRIKALLLSTVMVASLFVGCGSTTAPTSAQPAAAKPDAVASASVTKDPVVFDKAIGKDGTWIIAITENLTESKDLVLEGDFKDKDVPALVHRKIGLYNQDAKHVVTARYTLTAPKLTIKSPNASIEHGIFKGDIYVETNDFQLKDNKVDGNIYFKDDAAKAGFKMDKTSSVTGKQEVKK